MFSSSGEFLARRYVNQHSQITCRILTSQDIPIASLVFSHRIEQALSFRRKRIASTTNAFRLINFEGDFLPGLLVDVYEHGLVCQFLTAGMEVQKERIIPILQEHFQPTFIYERSDSSRRMEEGLTPIRSCYRVNSRIRCSSPKTASESKLM